MPNSLTPEDRIRMLMNLDGKFMPAAPPPEWTPSPPITPLPDMQTPLFYDAGMMYVGEGDPPPGSSPMTDPDSWAEAITSEPPSRREKVAAAHRKRKAMGY